MLYMPALMPVLLFGVAVSVRNTFNTSYDPALMHVPCLQFKVYAVHGGAQSMMMQATGPSMSLAHGALYRAAGSHA